MYKTKSLGFRGEAHFTLAQFCDLEFHTRLKDAAKGHVLKYDAKSLKLKSFGGSRGP